MKNDDVYVLINATRKAEEFGIPVRDIVIGIARAKFFTKTIEHRRVVCNKQKGLCPKCGEDVSAEKGQSELHHEQAVREAVTLTLSGNFTAVDDVTRLANLSVVHLACHDVIEERKSSALRKRATPSSSCCRRNSSRHA